MVAATVIPMSITAHPHAPQPGIGSLTYLFAPEPGSPALENHAELILTPDDGTSWTGKLDGLISEGASDGYVWLPRKVEQRR
jgi:hypothetical protein